ncbi:MAG: twin-arginine translocase subunit TatC [Prevotellaceae bacterium]|nr:twin-arginine translocase subunit TatC [Prevotellaceae bacterium]MDY3856396.1 twin-arginine translocase subunit TatC [Bacteroidaceae bacterium]
MSDSDDSQNIGTFWDHLDVLRSCIIKIIVATLLLAIVCFSLKDLLFSIVLAPTEPDFITYKLLGMHPQKIGLMNIGLTEQFMIHMKTALYAGILLASPYILYQIFCFVSPGLYENERKYAVRVVGGAYVMFILGTLLNYFVIFPMTVHFLGTYQVASDVANMLTLQSYMDTLLLMNLVMGVVFELPVVCWLLACLGLLNDRFMRTYRRHAIVVILIISAIITPTSDVFTLMVVALPIWALYEVSIIIVKRAQRKPKAINQAEENQTSQTHSTEVTRTAE